MKPLNLNRELVHNVMRVLEEHDDQARDPRIAAQYLSALTGLLIGNEKLPPEARREMLEELSAFSAKVLSDVLGQQAERPAPPAVDPAKAFGIWKPPGR